MQRILLDCIYYTFGTEQQWNSFILELNVCLYFVILKDHNKQVHNELVFLFILE